MNPVRDALKLNSRFAYSLYFLMARRIGFRTYVTHQAPFLRLEVTSRTILVKPGGSRGAPGWSPAADQALPFSDPQLASSCALRAAILGGSMTLCGSLIC